MAGHSKFKNIMYRKGAQDAKRSKLFSKLSKEITVAAKVGGADIDGNSRLRVAVQNAKSQSVPRDNIERAIKKADSSDLESFSEMRYEGYGPGGIAVIVEALTDNKNRTASTVRSLFTKSGGSLGETGALSFMFDHVGEITYPLETGDADKVMEAAIEAGAEDAETDEDEHTITTAFEDMMQVARDLEKSLGEPKSVNLIWRPQTLTELDADKAAKILKLINALEDDDDIQNVFGNFDIPDDVMEGLV